MVSTNLAALILIIAFGVIFFGEFCDAILATVLAVLAILFIA